MTLVALGLTSAFRRLLLRFGAAWTATSITAIVKRLPLSCFDNTDRFTLSRQQCRVDL
jgi:hypothetical protein